LIILNHELLCKIHCVPIPILIFTYISHSQMLKWENSCWPIPCRYDRHEYGQCEAETVMQYCFISFRFCTVLYSITGLLCLSSSMTTNYLIRRDDDDDDDDVISPKATTSPHNRQPNTMPYYMLCSSSPSMAARAASFRFFNRFDNE
jgi:hypothetical protein